MPNQKDKKRALLNALGYNQIIVDLAVKAHQLKTLNFPEAAKQVESVCKNLHHLKEQYLSGKIESGSQFIELASLNYKDLKSGYLKDNKVWIEVTGMIKNFIDQIKNLFGQKNLKSKSMDEITQELSKTLSYAKNYTLFKPAPKIDKPILDEPEPKKAFDVD